MTAMALHLDLKGNPSCSHGCVQGEGDKVLRMPCRGNDSNVVPAVSTSRLPLAGLHVDGPALLAVDDRAALRVERHRVPAVPTRARDRRVELAPPVAGIHVGG